MKNMDNLRTRCKKRSGYLGLALLITASQGFAEQVIVVAPNTVISHNTTYNNATLDMNGGNFIVTNNATLTISNSVINGTLSKKNPLLINVDAGNLKLLNNQGHIKVSNVLPHPTTQSLQYVVQLGTASAVLNGNSFDMDKPYASGFLITTASIPTSGINISGNKFMGFHGVLYLVGTDGAVVENNKLIKNSYGNIVIIGSNGKVVGNTIAFSGVNRLGNSVDVIDSNDVLVSKNTLLTPTCHGFYIFNSRNVTVDNNKIFGGITYGMNVLTYPEKIDGDDKIYLKHLLANRSLKNTMSQNITITNNLMAQNRYGIAGSDVQGLNVKNNVFIQRFDDHFARKFWTNNAILLQNVSSLSWDNNVYKEAFSQIVDGNNSNAFHTVPFPVTGGVTL